MEVFEYKNVVIDTPNSPQAEAYRKLEFNIRMTGIDNPFQVIQVTSPTPEDGKTTTVINLAAVYAEKGKKVIILDFDLRRPKIHRAFHKINDIGLFDYIADDKNPDDLVIHDESGIDLLLSGNKLTAPHIILQSKKIASLIEKLRSQYDYVLIDSPPVLTVTDALLISGMVDGVVYVLSYNKTKKDQAKLGLKQLEENKAKIIGSVLSNIDFKKNKSFYDYYYYREE